MLEYNGSTFHKNIITLESGGNLVPDHPIGSAGYVPLVMFVDGSPLEALLDVMIESFRETKTNPSIDSVKRVVDLCVYLSEKK